MAIDPKKVNEFLGRALVDFGATFHAALVRIGDKLGLYKTLAAGGLQTSAELAKRTKTAERYIRETYVPKPKTTRGQANRLVLTTRQQRCDPLIPNQQPKCYSLSLVLRDRPPFYPVFGPHLTQV